MLIAAGSLAQLGSKALNQFNRLNVLLFGNRAIREGLEEEHDCVDLIPDECFSGLVAIR